METEQKRQEEEAARRREEERMREEERIKEEERQKAVELDMIRELEEKKRQLELFLEQVCYVLFIIKVYTFNLSIIAFILVAFVTKFAINYHCIGCIIFDCSNFVIFTRIFD